MKGDDLARKLHSTVNLVEKCEERLLLINQQIQSLLEPQQLQIEMEECFQFSILVEDFKCELQQHQMQYFTANPSSAAKPMGMVIPAKVQDQSDDRFAKLPPLEMPSFSGDYTQWTSFLDQFDAMIGSKKHLQDTSKLFYLKGALRGDAKALISKMESNNAGNYQLARKVLQERYQNTRSIVKVHIEQIINAAVVKQDSGVSLRKYIQTLEDNLEGLRQLQVQTSGWGPLLVYHIYQKLDNETKKEFELQHPGTDVQKLDDLTVFLKNRAVALEAYGATFKKDQGQGQGNQAKKTDGTGGSYAAQQGAGGWKPKYPCASCNGDHGIWKCDEFAALTIDQRIKRVRELELCNNCLSKGHLAKDCKSTHRCKTCEKLHHSLLHLVGKQGKGHVGLAVRASKRNPPVASQEPPAVADSSQGKGLGIGTKPGAGD